MYKLIYIFCLSLISNLTFGQVRVFDNYNFDTEEYTLIGTWAHSDKSGLQDTLKEFYTTDRNILNEFKKEWIFNDSSPFYACGYHYFVHICKNGKSIEDFAINLNCNMISTPNGYFYFDSEKLRRFIGRLNKPKRSRKEFETIEKGRVFIDSILSNSKLLLTPIPDWTNYEGEFEFIYPCTDLKKKESCFDKKDEIILKLTKEIKEKYPGEPI